VVSVTSLGYNHITDVLQSGRTALCLAAVKHPQLVKLCVNNGANVNLQDAEVSG